MTDLRSRTVAQLDGWWVEVRCSCRAVHIPLRLAAKRGYGSLQVADYARRLRCQACGTRPTSASLTDDVQSGAHGHPSPAAPRYSLGL